MAWLSKGDCALCGRHRELVQDHDHDSGVIRSKICIACSSGLGQFQDDPEMLVKAAEYLRFWKKVPANVKVIHAKHPKPTTALKIFKVLSPEEQERILSSGGH